MKISIIIPAFNEEKLLPQCLRSLSEAAKTLDEAGWDYEIIVCDNNSTDRTAEIARRHGAQVVFEPVNQIARARNRGASAAKGEWFLFLDADSFPSRELFQDMIDAMRAPGVIGGGAIVRLDHFDFWMNLFESIWNWLSRRFRWAAGSFLFCRAEAFEKVGGFDNRLYASEELELSRQLKRLGKRASQRMVILNRHPLKTSSRKLNLYSRMELASMLFRSLVFFRSTVRNKQKCTIWYDGRR